MSRLETSPGISPRRHVGSDDDGQRDDLTAVHEGLRYFFASEERVRETGRGLIDRAVAAAGGAAVVDGVRTLREQHSVSQRRADGSSRSAKLRRNPSLPP